MKKKIAIIASAAVLLIALITAAVLLTNPPKKDENSSKNISVVITYSGGRSETFEITTDKKFLSEALYEKELITKEEFDAQKGYTAINGAVADYEIDAAWWCLTEKGSDKQLDFDTLEIQNGKTYEIEYTIG